jgi:hypothetical protein
MKGEEVGETILLPIKLAKVCGILFGGRVGGGCF